MNAFFSLAICFRRPVVINVLRVEQICQAQLKVICQLLSRFAVIPNLRELIKEESTLHRLLYVFI